MPPTWSSGPRPVDRESIAALTRRRLLRLIDERFEGKYTVLARRAGIPVSTMQHVMHTAKHLPGGEPLLKLATALGVTAQYLSTSDEAVRSADRPTPPPPPVRLRRVSPGRGDATHVTIPLFACGCPGPCPLTVAVPPLTAASSRVVLGAELVARHQTHRLIALQVTPGLQSAEWPVGAQLVVDWEARTPAWTCARRAAARSVRYRFWKQPPESATWGVR